MLFSYVRTSSVNTGGMLFQSGVYFLIWLREILINLISFVNSDQFLISQKGH